MWAQVLEVHAHGVVVAVEQHDLLARAFVHTKQGAQAAVELGPGHEAHQLDPT